MKMFTRYGANPFGDLASLQDRMNRMFNDTFSDYVRDPGMELTAGSLGGYMPPADVYEDQEHLNLKLEVPGFTENDLRITLENSILTVQGERRPENDEDKGVWHRRERFYGVFTRSFALPANVDPNTVKADYSNGVLELRLAKKAEAKPKQIPIGTGQKQVVGRAA